MQFNLHLIKLGVVLLFTISCCYSKIQINVKPESNEGRIVITYSGADDKALTEKDIRMFNVTKDNLKRGARIELGKIPDDIFLKEPTPFHNLYKKFNWMEVTRRVRVKNAEIFEIINQNVTLAVQSVINNTTGRIKKTIGIRETVENTISSSWLDKGIPGHDMLYSVNITYDKQSFLFKNRWRDNNVHGATLSFGISNDGDIFLDAGQVASVELRAVKSISLLKVNYSAGLVGSVIATYVKLYGSHYFWAPNIESVMDAAKLKNEIITTEIIEIRSYFYPQLKIVDKNTLEPIHIIKPYHIKKAKTK